ncbi:MAG: VanZ family protein [Armatimonadota bacterium]|nr:VanZ family protein [Armatimonadota bacterium]MCX7778298.1 VanZ family protein [Armatimonadota bacterium]MDW8026314.1 VanZ family protein [Armatimonadota bacterium]
MKKRGCKIAAAIAYIVVLTISELLPLNAPKWEVGGIGVDKLAHTAAYGLMTLLLSTAFEWMGLVVSSLLALAHSIIIEVVQACLPRRTADIYDLLAGVIGIVAVVAALNLLRRFSELKA